MNDYERIAAVIAYLDKHHSEQPSLAVLARRAGLSTFHFHRMFSRWAGITPKDFLQCLTLSHSKALLAEGKDVLSAALSSGLSGPSRLHDLCVSLEAASPGEIKSGGANWTIRAGFVKTPFGMCLVGEGPRGICHLSFVESVSRKAGSEAIRRHWPRAALRWDDGASAELVGPLFQRPANSDGRPALKAFVRCTAFQFRVWRALLQVPPGALVSYSEVASALGNRGAARAVGTAVSQNQLAYLIPCHRVIRDTGALGDYHWGETRKKAMLVWDSSKRLRPQLESSMLESWGTLCPVGQYDSMLWADVEMIVVPCRNNSSADECVELVATGMRKMPPSESRRILGRTDVFKRLEFVRCTLAILPAKHMVTARSGWQR